MPYTDGELLSKLLALDSYTSTSSPPEPDEMDAMPDYPDAEVVVDRFGSWTKALARVDLVRDPDKPPKVPIRVRMTVRARAQYTCEQCDTDTTESQGGLTVVWDGDPPANPDEADADDAVALCADCSA